MRITVTLTACLLAAGDALCAVEPGITLSGETAVTTVVQAEALAAAAAQMQTVTSECITMRFKDADLKNIVRLVARCSGANIVSGPDVELREHLPSISVHDVHWSYALYVVLKNCGYTYRREGTNLVRIVKDTVLTDAGVQPVASLTNGLLACWPFNGNARDASPEGNDGDVQGATLVADRFGVRNAAYYFNGTDNYIWIGDQVRPASISVSLWFKSATTSIGSGYGAVLIRDRWNGHGASLNTTGQVGQLGVSLSTADGEFSDVVRYANTYNDDHWHHLVYSWDQHLFNVYIDGMLLIVDAQMGNGPMYAVNGADGGGLAIGRDGNYPGGYYEGCMDDVCIYNRALTFDEVRMLYRDRGQLSSLAAKAEKSPSDPAWASLSNSEFIAVLPLSTDESTGIVFGLSVTRKDTQTMLRVKLVPKGFVLEPVVVEQLCAETPDGVYGWTTPLPLASLLGAANMPTSAVPYALSISVQQYGKQRNSYSYLAERTVQDGDARWNYKFYGGWIQPVRDTKPQRIGWPSRLSMRADVRDESRQLLCANVYRLILCTSNNISIRPTAEVRTVGGEPVTNNVITSYG